MKRVLVKLVMIVCLFGLSSIVLAQWTSIAPGIDYRQYSLSAPDPVPNNVFITRMDRSNLNCIIDSTLPLGQLRTGRETVSGMATRYDQSINAWGGAWGQRSRVVVAVNGDGWTSLPGPTNGQVISGWQAKRWAENAGGTGFVWKLDRSCFIAGNVRNGNTPGFNYQFITFAGGSNTVVTNVNAARTGADNELIVYTPQFADNTYTDNTGTEVLVEMTRPLVPTVLGSGNYVYGTIKQIRQNAGSTPIPFDHMVLSGTGTYETLLTSACTVGAQIRFQFEIHDTGTQGQVPTPSSNWTEAYAAVGCFAHVVKNGIIPVDDWVNNSSAWVRNPRTCVAFNDNYVYFLVCDGRRPGVSIGMTYPELGSFCINSLGAQWATNQDGGGSSAMWVNGSVVNIPSDGSERLVANGLTMVVVEPKVQSTSLVVAQRVTTSGSANVRLGPGTNYGVRTTVSSGAQGQIISQPLNGVLAKGSNWWYVDFGGGTVGWVAQTLLIGGGVAPTITQQPASQTIAVGATAGFTVTSSGDSPLSYQWQKNESNLANGGHYSGATSATLTITTADAADVADYRCVVTNAFGTATSDEASLTLSGKPTITQHPLPGNACAGGTVALSVVASGQGTLTYQWQKNGSNLAEGGHYSGTTTAVVTVSSVDTNDAGSYRCIVGNLAGSTTSNLAPLGIDAVYAIVGVGGTNSTITGVSTNGAVVAGNSGGGFVWSAAHGVVSLGAGSTTAGVATKNGAVVVGGVVGGNASRWDGNPAGVGAWTTLPTTGVAWTPLCTSAQDGSPGDVCIGGNSGSATGARLAVRFKESTNSTSSLTLPTKGNPDAYVRGVSDGGVYAGQYQYSKVSPSGSRQAMGGATLTPLFPLIGASSTSNEGIANAISRDGTKAGGWSWSALTQRQATIWTIANPSSPTAVPFIGSDNISEVQAMNGDGSIVAGYATASGSNRHVFIWDAINLTRDLQTWLLSQYGLSTTGWTFTDVKGISGDGKVIAGNGVHNGNTEGWIVLLGAPGTAPTLTQQPSAQNICPGAGTTFTVAATGLGAINYQWQKNGSDLTDDAHHTGTTTPTLAIPSADAGDAASYRCVVSVGCSSTTSNPAALTVKVATAITQQPTAQSVEPGATAQFSVTATGEGAISYQWQKDGNPLAEGGHYSGTTSTTLVISNADGADAANYSCVVTAGCGTAPSNEVALTVNITVPPDFDRDGDVDVNDLNTFTSCASGPMLPYTGDCGKADFDDDGDVDGDDFGVFQRCFTGENQPADLHCAD